MMMESDFVMATGARERGPVALTRRQAGGRGAGSASHFTPTPPGNTAPPIHT
jgi:hypothetical protein